MRGETFLNSSDTISSFWRWIEDPVGLGLVVVQLFLFALGFFGNLVDVGFGFGAFWRIWFYFPFLFYL